MPHPNILEFLQGDLLFKRLFLFCKSLLHLFDELEGGRTICYILLIHISVFHNFLFRVVWKTSAITRTHIIDLAMICFQVQELAGRFFVYPVAGTVFNQPFFPKGPRAHAQIGGDPYDVFLGIGWGHGPATVCTFQTVRARPGQFVYFQCDQVQIFRCLSFQPAEKKPKFSFITANQLSEYSEIDSLIAHGREKFLNAYSEI